MRVGVAVLDIPCIRFGPRQAVYNLLLKLLAKLPYLSGIIFHVIA